jgi:hypothetical protein
MAEFAEPETLVTAAERAYTAGYRQMDAYTPFPVEGLAEAIGFHHTWLSAIVLAGGLLGAVVGFGMQVYGTVFSYPMNIGGRPLFSWPAYIPITFELAILFAGFAAIFGMLALNNLPMPYHPVFNTPNFEQASRHRFFLSIKSEDPRFDLEETRRFLEDLHPTEVTEVPW